MHHLSLLLSQLALSSSCKASAPPKIQRAQLNKEKLLCGFSSSNDWWPHSPPRRGWWSSGCSLAITPNDFLRTVPLPSPVLPQTALGRFLTPLPNLHVPSLTANSWSSYSNLYPAMGK